MNPQNWTLIDRIKYSKLKDEIDVKSYSLLEDVLLHLK